MSGDLLTLEWQGRKYALDIQSVTAKEYRDIKQHLGLKQGEFLQSFTSLGNLESDSIVALLWLCQKRAGENVRLTDYDDLPVMDVMAALELPAGETPKGETTT